MSVIVPTVNVETAAEYQALMQVYTQFTNRVQVDLTDGQFVAKKTPTLGEIRWPSVIDVDLHLMVKRPSEWAPDVVALRPRSVIFHAESDEDLLPSFEILRAAGIKTGVAFAIPSFPGNYRPYLEVADYALIFAGELGENGSKADLLQAEKVHLIHEINGTIEIGWDGGANFENVFLLTKAGVNTINVGAALRTENPAETYKLLTREANREGAI